MNNIIKRTRILDINKKLFQMHRNTRIDSHTINFLKNIDNNYLHRYPLIEDFIKRYAHFLKIKENNLLLTSGVDGAIRCIFELYACNLNVAVLDPTYAMYRVYSDAYNANFFPILPNINTLTVDIDNVIDTLKKDIKVLFLPNPNVPIENNFTIEQLHILSRLSDEMGFILFIDEAYYGFGSESFINYINRYENVYVARSFSKWFGLPSIRLGCIISNEKNIQKLETFRLAYETNELSISVANLALDNLIYFKNYASEIFSSRQLIKNIMTKYEIKTHGDVSNNILIKRKLDYLSKNILVRENIPYPAENWISLTLGCENSTNIFIKAFEELLGIKI